MAQHSGSVSPRSTLATLTEIHDHLRLLWARLGTPHCWQCGAPIRRHTIPEIVRQTLALPEGAKIYLLAPVVRGAKGDHAEVFQQLRQAGFLRARVDGVLTEVRDNPRLNPKVSHTIDWVVDRLVVRPGIEERLTESLRTAARHGNGSVIVTHAEEGDWTDLTFSTRYACPNCQISYDELTPRSFSFNNPQAACPRCDGLGVVLELDPQRVVPRRDLPLSQLLSRLKEQTGGRVKLSKAEQATLLELLETFPTPPGVAWGPKTPLALWPEAVFAVLLHGRDDTVPPLPGLLPQLRRLGEAEDGADGDSPLTLDDFAGQLPCPECGGARLRPEARSVRFAGRALHEVTALTVDAALAWFSSAACGLAGSASLALPAKPQAADQTAQSAIKTVLFREITHRLHFLQEVGLGYLTLDRPAPTLSGGEAQRARLATYLGAGLLGVCYILDEPTIGLHPRDTARLLAALRGLQTGGNTVVVVEHDEAVMRAADYLIDMGPGAGRNGGRVVAHGTVAEVLRNPESLTAAYLRGTGVPPVEVSTGGTPVPRSRALVVRGGRHHNLKDITVAFPLGGLICVTGVSGSGKSSLVRDTLCPAVRRHLGLNAPPPGAHDAIDGLDHIDKIIEVDQAPLGRSARSNPATYTGVFDEIRKIFASTREAKLRGYGPSRFSFNVRGGRCEECQGQGVRRVALHLLPDLTVPCPVCHGKRFTRPTLEIRYRGLSIADVLDLSVQAARATFENIPHLVRPLQALVDVGLGYLKLGQASSALSGGEAQRVKLAAELARAATGRTLFVLDEPTTGLHFGDVAVLLGVLRRLTMPGNTVVVIEHHLDVIAAADWVIDLGPEAGAAGGRLIVAGTPADVAACLESITGRYLAMSGQGNASNPSRLDSGAPLH